MHRLPLPVTRKPPNAASMRGLQEAMAALQAPASPMGSEVLLAERARLESEADAAQRRQQPLPLRPVSP